MKVNKLTVSLAVFGTLLAIPAVSVDGAQGRGGGPGMNPIGPCVAGSFEEAMELNERLRLRYEQSSPEIQAQIQTRWELRRERWSSLSDEQRTAIRNRVQDRRAFCDGTGPGRRGFKGRNGNGRRGW